MKGTTLSYEDPFNDAPAQQPVSEDARYGDAPNPTNPPAAAQVTASKPVVVAPAEGKVTTTFKGGRDFDAPWIVIHSSTVEEAIETVRDTDKLKELFQLTQSGAKFFAGLGGGSAPAQQGGGQAAPQQQSRAPQGATQAPNGETRTCAHGPMVFKSGVSKAGNAYKLFSCTAPRNEQCKAEYLR
ncbi:hypothetical protein SEA_DARTHPHADER_47 [Mycobacterium phage DarthPhader]|uniref:Uncharacterized protein n=1 Tax=Mycobacterium phage DarthPhader TaxID=1912975 RepID=A0A1I9S3Z3_9CAUD|nr:ribonucleoside reductase class II [Mycobacterium phage DarthPhader]AOZ61287.1 hypothetical protein SEA_DARTHPHADER_47 [Mycobacterium phage DarthPhader]